MNQPYIMVGGLIKISVSGEELGLQIGANISFFYTELIQLIYSLLTSAKTDIVTTKLLRRCFEYISPKKIHSRILSNYLTIFNFLLKFYRHSLH